MYFPQKCENLTKAGKKSDREPRLQQTLAHLAELGTRDSLHRTAGPPVREVEEGVLHGALDARRGRHDGPGSAAAVRELVRGGEGEDLNFGNLFVLIFGKICEN